MLPNTTSDHLKHKPAIAFGSQIRKGSEKDLPKKNLRNAEKNVYINQLFWEQSPFPIPSLIFIPLTLLRARSRQVGKQRSISSGSITQMFHYKHHFTPVNNATCSEIHICWRVQDQSLVCAHANILPRSSGGVSLQTLAQQLPPHRKMGIPHFKLKSTYLHPTFIIIKPPASHWRPNPFSEAPHCLFPTPKPFPLAPTTCIKGFALRQLWL